MAPGDLEKALCGIEFPDHPDLIVGLGSPDDAGVYKLTDELAIIQTVDFFTPIVDDPYWFGQIAAANALSDIYAMGGKPITAMNLVGFPSEKMGIDILREILKGGIDKLTEAEVVLVGGHSVDDQELKYGLSVTGIVHPKKVLTKRGLRPGDSLVLTKPLGTGIINTAIKAGLASEKLIDYVTSLMAALNRDAAEVMQCFNIHACTDITGFGLLGHLAEMVEKTDIGVKIEASRVPIIEDAVEFASMGFVPAGTRKNYEFRKDMVVFSSEISEVTRDILFDPQTSGGLLISLERTEAADLLSELKSTGVRDAANIGEVVTEPRGKIVIA